MFILASDEACGLISETTVYFIASLIKAIKYLVPILLIVMGSLDFVKATFSQKDDELKDAKTKFINKLVAGIAVFFVFSFVTWLVNLLAENFGIKSLECVNSFLSGSYKESDIGDISGNKFEQCQKNCEEKSGGNATGYSACLSSNCNKYTTTTTTTTINSNKETCFTKCFNEGKDEAYCNKHCGDIPEGNWDSCMSSCLEVRNEAYCNKHCDVKFNGGINNNQNITTTTNKVTTTTTNKQTANNTNEWDKCMNSCQDAGRNQDYCKKNCDTELNGGAN